MIIISIIIIIITIRIIIIPIISQRIMIFEKTREGDTFQNGYHLKI